METRTADVCGLALVDKPAGMTSHDVVAVVRRATKARRAGHAGTLDPFATGLLVVLLGRATRLIPFMDGEPKVYDATIRFGEETDTDDATGVVVRRAEQPADASLAEAIARLTGSLEQTPPAYSAKSVGGVRAYAAARRGAPLELSPTRVVVSEWSNVAREGPDLRARITCSGGTYIRALARDLGRATDSAAHLTALRRVSSGRFSVDAANSLDEFENGRANLLGPRDAVPHIPAQQLTDDEQGRVSHGNPVAARIDGESVALVHGSTLLAIAQRVGDQLHPKTVLADG